MVAAKKKIPKASNQIPVRFELTHFQSSSPLSDRVISEIRLT